MNAPPLPPVHLPARNSDAHKGNFGRVMLVGGSRGMSGSIALSSMAALKTGSGLVTAAVPDRCLETVASFHPCMMVVPLADDAQGRFATEAALALPAKLKPLDAIACGPGMTMAAGSVRIVERLLQTTALPRVLDADAINVLALMDWPAPENVQSSGRLVLTPHPGELHRLTGVPPSDREQQISIAQILAERTGAVIVVKGGPTVVVSGDQRWTNTTGNPGMATGGSGDVLTGVITSLLGQKMDPWDATRLGVWVHGRAGDLAAAQHGEAGMTALDILEQLPHVIRQCVE
ncbi:ATP-dependent (S)-NAD(P)H-hydrate dehydratase [Rubripirellula lacrimiformis]|uniref:ADP-dependent (S)-NAD(P)H-hydrate dehydratase n=1 Tax=Rubripirellula lacrimiformis TaxID=1930273 RepID=A0A517N5Y4_9BACT|nr:NAD(P)H-hydrate dehydratase [Rubripirellula lacrimiformis]QDT02521.1 ATP-dependent (S)-NAD(P)H-hydrate dehydratase [Rubripirellula lacrimiformis]